VELINWEALVETIRGVLSHPWSYVAMSFIGGFLVGFSLPGAVSAFCGKVWVRLGAGLKTLSLAVVFILTAAFFTTPAWLPFSLLEALQASFVGVLLGFILNVLYRLCTMEDLRKHRLKKNH
jgi:hypothetical protein